MKRILILIHVLFCGYICPLLAEDTGAVRYQDSILKVADTLPATLVRLTYLRDMAYKHQYAPYNMTFSTRLYEEARRQKNAFYENMGAYYLAACYDKKHDPDSLSYWVDVLKDFVPQVGTYDYYGVSSRPNEALDSFLEAYRNFSPQTKASLKVDILSRIAQVYGNGGKDSLKLPYLHEMDMTLQTVISKEPETRKNWSNFEIDCEVKYILHYMNQKNFTVAHEHIEKVKKLLEPHVDPVFWLNVQLIQLQYYAKTDEYDKSIALIDEVTPTVLNNYVSTFATLINYKASTQYDKGDIDGAIETRRYLIRKQDSLNNAFSANQLKQVKEIYHIDELLLEKQKIQDMNYRIGFIFLGVCLLLMLLFYLYTRYVSGKIAVIEKKTAEAALQAETDNIAKERLKSEISHDIRTPLNVVVGFAELLTGKEELDKETKREYGQMIQTNAESLLNYVNSILELSRLESGKIQYEDEECDIIQLCSEVLDKVNGRGESTVSVSLQTDLKEQLARTDRRWFDTLLVSLLTPSENDTSRYEAIIRIRRDRSKPLLYFDVVNAPFAKVHFENKTSLIRHEINAHFIHYFGGIYKVQTEAEEGPTISFTIPCRD